MTINLTIGEVLETKEFKKFVKSVAAHTGRRVDSCTVGPGYILVDGYEFRLLERLGDKY